MHSKPYQFALLHNQEQEIKVQIQTRGLPSRFHEKNELLALRWIHLQFSDVAAAAKIWLRTLEEISKVISRQRYVRHQPITSRNPIQVLPSTTMKLPSKVLKPKLVLFSLSTFPSNGYTDCTYFFPRQKVVSLLCYVRGELWLIFCASQVLPIWYAWLIMNY